MAYLIWFKKYRFYIIQLEYPNKCWLEGDKVAVAVGESYQPVGECKSYLCRDDFSFEILG